MDVRRLSCPGATSDSGIEQLHSSRCICDAGPTLEIEVDARDLPRRLLHAQIHVPCKPGKLGLWYPKWIPGTHAPSGPIQDVAGLRLETAGG